MCVYSNSYALLHSLGEFEGLPKSVKSSDNVHTLTVPSNESLLTLNLTCNCSVYLPQWHIKLIGEVSPGEKVDSFYLQGIECINNTGPCSRNIDYIHPINKSRGLYVYSRQNLTVTRSTAIMCYSNIIREVLIVSFTNGKRERETKEKNQLLWLQMYVSTHIYA